MTNPIVYGDAPVEEDRISTEALFKRFGNKLDDVLSIPDPAVSKCLTALLGREHVRLGSYLLRLTSRLLRKVGVAGMTDQEIRDVFTATVSKDERSRGPGGDS